MRSALIHRARVLTRAVGARNAQGEKQDGAATPGPWFAARLMERGGPASKRRRRPQEGTDAKVVRGYELLAAPVDDVTGAAVVLTASSLVETDCPILGSPKLELDGKPEKLTNGVTHIGWMALAVEAKDSA